MEEQVWADAEVMLRDWLRRAREAQHSHHEVGKVFRAANYWLGVPVILITTVLGTTAFAAIEQQQISTAAKGWFGALSMLAAALTALQTHFRYSERGEQHKYLGAEYGNIRREIETILALPPSQREQPKIALDHIRVRFDAISNDGQVVSRRVFERTLKRLAERDASRKTDDTRRTIAG